MTIDTNDTNEYKQLQDELDKLLINIEPEDFFNMDNLKKEKESTAEVEKKKIDKLFLPQGFTRKQVIFSKKDNLYIFNCPHCDILISVDKNKTKCKIFRCGVMKSNGIQINPHTSKNKCDYLSNNNLIYGCSKPFKFFQDTCGNYVDICDYK
jgi:hypothetical protein